MTMRIRGVPVAALVALTCCLDASSYAVAQTAPAKASAKSTTGGTNLPNAFQGFSRDRNDPVKIDANTLEVYDRENYAVFIGNVFVQQGESTLRCRQLKVFYEGGMLSKERVKKSKSGQPVQPKKTDPVAHRSPAGSAAKTGKSDQAGQTNLQQKIRKLEAIGGVIVASKDQKATGDFGIFDMPTNTATITGNVVVSQGPNVIRGEKLVVDLNTGFSRMEAGGKAGSTRVQGLFVPNTLKKDGKSKKTSQPQQQSKQ